MAEPESVFRLKSLDTAKPSKFLLSVYFPVPFGMGKNVFQVDRLEYNAVSKSLTGWGDMKDGYPSSGDIVVTFPDTFQYMMVTRDNYEVISMEEAKKVMAEAEAEEKEEGKPYEPSTPFQYL